MRLALRALRNTTVILIGKILSKVLGLAVFLVLTWHLRDTGYGQYSFMLVYVGVAQVLADAGVTTILTREMAQQRHRMAEILGLGMVIRLVVSVVVCGAAMLLVRPLYPDLDPTFRFNLYLLCLSLLANFATTYEVVFRVHLRMEYPTLIDLFRNSLFLGGVVVIVLLNLSLTAVIWLLLLTSVIAGIFLYTLSRPFVRAKWVWDAGLAARILNASLPLAIASLAIMAYYRVDTLMLKAMQNDAVVGQYNSAVRVAEAFNILPSALMVSIFPLLAQFWTEDHNRFLRTIELSANYCLMAVIPAALVAAFFAPAMLFFLRAEFFPAARCLPFLLWAEVFMVINMVFYQGLNAMGRQRYNMTCTLVMLLLNVLLNWALIPSLSHRGASLATMLTELLGTILLWMALRRSLRSSILGWRVVKIAAAALVLTLVLGVGHHWGVETGPALIGLLLLAGVVYTGLLFKLGAVDWRELRALLRRSEETEA